jgi:acetyltransferase-like isoleucine patch superfamily enzyme
MFLKLISFLFPWVIRRVFLNKFFGFKIERGARIGFAWIFPKELSMAPGAVIDHFSVAIHLDSIKMGANSVIGRSNWITGFTTNSDSLHFKHQVGRKAELILMENAAITKNHHLDCTNSIHVGRFSTVAGYSSQLLTHSINIAHNRQDSAPIYIGHYTFVGTNVVVLGGSTLPDYSVLGAKSLLNKNFTQKYTLYAGVPARPVKELPIDSKYFSRAEGFVN